MKGQSCDGVGQEEIFSSEYLRGWAGRTSSGGGEGGSCDGPNT